MLNRLPLSANVRKIEEQLVTLTVGCITSQKAVVVNLDILLRIQLGTARVAAALGRIYRQAAK